MEPLVTSRPVPPELLERFRVLLITWRPHFLDGRWAADIEQLLSRDPARPHDLAPTLQAYEDRFGDGHYEQRKESLDALLTFLASRKKVDLSVVCQILTEARERQFQAESTGREIDFRRGFFTLRDRVLTDFHESAERLRLLLDETGDPGPRRLKVHRALERLLILLARYEPFTMQPWGPLRRGRAGHQPEPWLADARRKLAAGHVAKETRDELLQIVGLTPYRPQ